MTRRVVVLAVLLAGCGGEKAPGRVVGDAFMAQNIDQQINLASMPVHLLRTDEMLDSTLAPLCPPRGPGNEAAWARGWEARKRILRPLVLRSVTTNAQAQFAFDTVAPGEYMVWADTVLSERRWSWLSPIRVRSGDTLRIDLTNDNSDENPLRCGPADDG